MIEQLTTIEINPHSDPDLLVIWLHGLGADANDFVPIVEYLDLPSEAKINFLFPNAPVRTIKINPYPLRAWHDLSSLPPKASEIEDDIQTSIAQIHHLIKQQSVPIDRIVLVGFSQGGAIALRTALSSENPFKGAVGLSTYLPFEAPFSSITHPNSLQTPFLIVHGTDDEVVPELAGSTIYEQLNSHHYQVTYRKFPVAHTVDINIAITIGQFLSGLQQLTS